MTSRASLPLPLKLRHFQCCIMLPKLDKLRRLLVKNIKALR
jgi:hypothetical protein